MVHGHPGSGKTTALWKAIEARDNQRVLYVSWSRELTNLAAERLSTFAPSNVSVTTRDFLTLLGEGLRLRCGARFLRAEPRSVHAGTRKNPQPTDRPWSLGDLGQDALYAEVRAVLLGRAIPDEPGCAYIDSLTAERRTWPVSPTPSTVRVRGGRNGVGEGASGKSSDDRRTAGTALGSGVGESVPRTGGGGRVGPEIATGTIIPRGFDNFDRIVVDEAQDLTLVEVAVVTELCRAIALRRRRSAPWLLLAGDEGQTVRPSGFEWSLLSGLLAHTLTAPQRFTLDTTLRSPERIAKVIERASQLYQKTGLERRLRPADQRHEPGGDPTEAQLFYVDAPSVKEAIRLMDRLNDLANVAVVTPGIDAPAWLPGPPGGHGADACGRQGPGVPERVRAGARAYTSAAKRRGRSATPTRPSWRPTLDAPQSTGCVLP